MADGLPLVCQRGADSKPTKGPDSLLGSDGGVKNVSAVLLVPGEGGSRVVNF